MERFVVGCLFGGDYYLLFKRKRLLESNYSSCYNHKLVSRRHVIGTWSLKSVVKCHLEVYSEQCSLLERTVNRGFRYDKIKMMAKRWGNSICRCGYFALMEIQIQRFLVFGDR